MFYNIQFNVKYNNVQILHVPVHMYSKHLICTWIFYIEQAGATYCTSIFQSEPAIHVLQEI